MPNPNGTAYFLVTIAYADGARASISMVQVNPSSALLAPSDRHACRPSWAIPSDSLITAPDRRSPQLSKETCVTAELITAGPSAPATPP
jgi:hypothetical protein